MDIVFRLKISLVLPNISVGSIEEKYAVVFTKISKGQQELLLNFKKIFYYEHKPELPSYTGLIEKIDVPDESLKIIQDKTLGQISQFSTTKYRGKPLGSYFNYKDANFWYYHRFRIYHKLLRFNIQQWIISELSHTDDNLYVFTDIGFEFRRKRVSQVKVLSQNKNTVNYKNIFFFIIRVFRSLSSPLKVNDHLMVYKIERKQSLVKLDDTKKTIKEFDQLYYLKEQFKNEFTYLEELTVPKIRSKNPDYSGLITPIEKNAFLPEYLLLRGLFYISSIRKKINIINQLLEEIQEKNDIEEHTRYILSSLRSFSSSSLVYLIKYEGFLWFFNKHKFRSVISSDENSVQSKIILDAAKFHGIPTFGVQHGVIHELHPAYIYSDDEQRLFAPTSDYLFTWGEKWNRVLLGK